MGIHTPHAVIINSTMLKNVPERYMLTMLAAKRAHAIERGSVPLISSEECGTHKPTVIALLEIEAGLITEDYLHNQEKIERSWKAEKEKMEGERVEKESILYPRSSSTIVPDLEMKV